jgi:hypothetical protein
LQVHPHAFLISQVNAADAAEQGTAASNRTIGTGKVVYLPYA